MSLSEIPEMKQYLKELESNTEFTPLLDEDNKALAEADRDPSGLDWADLPGTDILRQYWLDAESDTQQAQLGHINHLRARAWEAVWENYLPDEIAEKH